MAIFKRRRDADNDDNSQDSGVDPQPKQKSGWRRPASELLYPSECLLGILYELMDIAQIRRSSSRG